MRINDYRAGEYVQQYEYQSFSPTLVNHCWVLDDAQIQQLLSNADRALGELSAFSQLVPDVDFFIRMHIAKEATQSSRIEGTRTNMQEAFMDKQDIELERRDDWQEVQNYIEAINHGIVQLDTLPLSNRLLKDTHKVLMRGVRGENKLPGEFRTSQNWIGMSLKNASFIPPHHEEIDSLMGDLELFLHNEELKIPHLIKIAIAHYQFETIHPFLDGNGRLGRLLIALYFASFSLLHKPALYLSDFFERHKIEYVDHLMAVRSSNQLHSWLVFFLYGVVETAASSIQVFKDILTLKAKLEQEVLPRFGTRRQNSAQLLMLHLYQTPMLSIKNAAELLDVKINTAAALIDDFVEMEVLAEVTGKQRNRLFCFVDYLMIFKPA